ncbi:methyltransferase [Aspergillus insuetus]
MEQREALIQSEMTFLEPWQSQNKVPVFRPYDPPGSAQGNIKLSPYAVKFHNARPDWTSFGLDTHGFMFIKDHVESELLEQVRAGDMSVVEQEYFACVRDLVQRVTGAERVLCFSPSIRNSATSKDILSRPGSIVHCDQSPDGVVRVIQAFCGDEADHLLQGRYRSFSVWRPTVGPVADWPLAVADGKTIDPAHLQEVKWIVDGCDESSPGPCQLSYSADQRWYYLDGQCTDEVTIVKNYDSADVPVKQTAHGSFSKPSPSLIPRARESIDVRCLVFGGM